MFATEAAAMAFALEAGVLQIAQIQTWADKNLLEQEHPDYALIELSTGSTVATCLSLLHSLSIGYNPITCARLALGYLRSGLASSMISHKGAADLLDRLRLQGCIPNAESEYLMLRFSNDLYRIAFGDYSPELKQKINNDLDTFLAQYAI